LAEGSGAGEAQCVTKVRRDAPLTVVQAGIEQAKTLAGSTVKVSV
jgi:hypothetical protein